MLGDIFDSTIFQFQTNTKFKNYLVAKLLIRLALFVATVATDSAIFVATLPVSNFF